MTDKNVKPINVKLDSETKSKFETLAYLQNMSLQDLGEKIIKDAINKNADVIADAEKLRSKVKK